MKGRTQKRPAVAGPGARNNNSHPDYTASAPPSTLLLPRLDAARTTGPGRWITRCPAHADNHPSLSIRETDDGTLLVRCWAGCDIGSVLAAVGLTLADLFPDRHKGRGPMRRGERWVPADVLRCLAAESMVMLVAAEAIARGQPLTRADVDRVALAAQRFSNAGREVNHG